MNDQNLEKYTTVFKAISNPMRLKILLLLEDGERCVCDFEHELNLDMSVISRHLKLLNDSNIVSSRREGKRVFYKLEMGCVLSFLHCIDNQIR
ncbi:ArsR/SmtB family transcription factor [Vibrio sp. E150_018]